MTQVGQSLMLLLFALSWNITALVRQHKKSIKSLAPVKSIKFLAL